MPRAALTGWGNTSPGVAEVRRTTATRLPHVLHEHGPRGALLRGLGRSYGDAAQNSGGTVWELDDSVHGMVLDRRAGTVTVGAGVSFDDLLGEIVPQGFFVPVTPGTRFVTVGGAIASDIHGKNHHRDGSLGEFVASITLLLADGAVTTVSPEADADLHWATIGGVGLTGAILAATLRLIPITSSQVSVDTIRCAGLDELMAEMAANDATRRYSVAWLDPLATGRHLGRSVLTNADHAAASDLRGPARHDPLAYRGSMLAELPPLVPPAGVINRLTVKLFNELWYRKAPARREGELQSIPAFFHPLDAVGRWNRVYGRRGMIQFQFVVPGDRDDVIRAVVSALAGHGTPSFLAVLKRMGAADPSPLGFPQPGWTLALDVPAGSPGLAELLHGFDDVILDAGGRHYFAKDAHTVPKAIRRGYPRLAEWQAVQRRADPHGIWQSDMSRRLGLTERSPR